MGVLVGKVLEEICNVRKSLNLEELANLCQIERSHFSKIRLGKRGLTYEKLHQIIIGLKLEEVERQKLKQAWKVEQIGIEQYEKFQHVEQCIKSLNTFEEPLKLKNVKELEVKIKHLLEEDLQEEGSHIYAALPFDCALYPEIKSTILNIHDRKIYFKHAFCVDLNDEDVLKDNLEILQEILFYLHQVKNLEYKSYYRNCKEPDFISLYPYQIVTDKRLLLISKDYEKILEITQKDAVEEFKTHFNDICEKELIPFMTTQVGLETIYRDFKMENFQYFLFYHPCFMRYLTGEEIGKYLKGDYKKYIPLATQYLNDLRSSDNIIMMFSKKGLLEFAKDGWIRECDPNALGAFSPEDRMILLERLREDKNQFCIDGNIFNLETVTLTVSKNDRVIICPTKQMPKENIRQLKISSRQIIDAFVKYFEYFSFTFIQSGEMKNKAIDEAIEIARSCM